MAIEVMYLISTTFIKVVHPFVLPPDDRIPRAYLYLLGVGVDRRVRHVWRPILVARHLHLRSRRWVLPPFRLRLAIPEPSDVPRRRCYCCRLRRHWQRARRCHLHAPHLSHWNLKIAQRQRLALLWHIWTRLDHIHLWHYASRLCNIQLLLYVLCFYKLPLL